MVHLVASLVSITLLIGSAWLVALMLDEKRGAIATALGLAKSPSVPGRVRRVRVRSVTPVCGMAPRERDRRLVA